MTIKDRIEAIITDGSIIPVEALPERVYVGDATNDGGEIRIAGSIDGRICFNVDAMARIEDDQFAFIVKHELMHYKYATLPRPEHAVLTQKVDDEWVALLNVPSPQPLDR